MAAPILFSLFYDQANAATITSASLVPFLATSPTLPPAYRSFNPSSGAAAEFGTVAQLGAAISGSLGATVITSTTTPQLSIRYDASNKLDISVSSAGAVTLNATGASASITTPDPLVVGGTVSIATNAMFYQATTAAGVTVPVLGITANNPNAITRVVAATDAGGIDFTNAAQSQQWGTLIGGALALSAGLTANGAVQLGTAAGADLITIGGTGYGAAGASIRLNGLTSGAAAQTGTLTNAPSAGNPAFWIPINIAGAVRYIPAWS